MLTNDARVAVETAKEKVGAARKAIVRGCQAAEDGLDATALRVRRHPALAVGVSTAAGAFIGCAIGFAIGRCRRARG